MPCPATIIFRMSAESGGESAMTAFPITSNRVRRVEGDKREQTFPSDGGIYSIILALVLSSSVFLLRVRAQQVVFAFHRFLSKYEEPLVPRTVPAMGIKGVLSSTMARECLTDPCQDYMVFSSPYKSHVT